LPSTPSALVSIGSRSMPRPRWLTHGTQALREIRDVIAETDSLQLVSLWNSRRHQLSIGDCCRSSGYRDEDGAAAFFLFCFTRVNRSANNTAHLCVMAGSPSSAE
jgi:hypothetical protein